MHQHLIGDVGQEGIDHLICGVHPEQLAPEQAHERIGFILFGERQHGPHPLQAERQQEFLVEKIAGHGVCKNLGSMVPST